MKKLFLFATIAASGLFVSCSSSDDAVSDAQNTAIEDVDANGRPAIHVGIGNIAQMATRGTGTVGGVEGFGADLTGEVTNKWAGQHINVFMFTKGALDNDGNIIEAQKYETTFNLTNIAAPNENPNYLYNNTEMVTPGSAENKIPGMGAFAQTNSDEAMIEDGTIQYYPLSGNFDFFGYHLDDALDPDVAQATPATVDYYINKDDDDKWTVPFVIDGTQDLMSTKAALTTAQEGKISGRPNDYYSAYAARKDVQPILSFNHLLTRFAFFVKAGNKDAAGFTFGKYNATTAAEKNATLPDALNSTDPLDATGAANYNATLTGALPIDGTTPLTEAQANAYNAKLPNAVVATAGPFYSFTACWTEELGNPSWTTTGKVQFIKEQTEADGTYTIIQVIQNNLLNHADMDGKYFAVKQTAANFANVTTEELYWVTESAGTYTIGSTTVPGTILYPKAISVYNLGTVETSAATAAINAYNATLNSHATANVALDPDLAKAFNAGLSGHKFANDTLSDEEAIAYNATLPNAVKVGDDNPDAVPVIDDDKAVKVSRVAITSKVKGDMAVAWKGTNYGNLADEEKIVWNPAATNTAVLTLKERPYAKSLTGNDIADATYADFTDLKDQYDLLTDPAGADADAVTALNTKAAGRAKAYITKSTYDLLTAAGIAKYATPFTAQEALNEKLIALSPTAATWDKSTDKANLVPVGEALIVGETPRNDKSYVMDVDITQLLPTNWKTGATDEKTTSQKLLIKEPTGGWQINTSYNIILTVYSLERIEIITEIKPWDQAEDDVEVGADN